MKKSIKMINKSIKQTKNSMKKLMESMKKKKKITKSYTRTGEQITDHILYNEKVEEDSNIIKRSSLRKKFV